MSGWGQPIDDLAAATAQLLATGVVQAPQLEDAHAAMAARDAVVTELRALVGAVAHVAQVGEAREVAMFDITHRPAQALHQALSQLPRLVEFGAGGEISPIHDKTLPVYEQAWRAAHRASVGLEACVDALGQLTDQQAWDVLRDLADVAAAVPYIDHDLAEAIRPRIKAGDDLEIAYRLLSSERHDAVRIIANELRTRVPVAETHARPGHGRSTGASIAQLVSDPDDSGDLTEGMIRYTHTVSARSDTLSVGPQVGHSTAAVRQSARRGSPGACGPSRGRRQPSSRGFACGCFVGGPAPQGTRAVDGAAAPGSAARWRSTANPAGSLGRAGQAASGQRSRTRLAPPCAASS